jgi:hypothetical protein
MAWRLVWKMRVILDNTPFAEGAASRPSIGVGKSSYLELQSRGATRLNAPKSIPAANCFTGRLRQSLVRWHGSPSEILMSAPLTIDAGSSQPPRQAALQVAVEVLLIVAVFFIVAGDAPPHVNESHYLCRVKHYWNPSWCAGDLFLESADTQLVLIWLFGWVTQLLSLTATAWIGRLAAWIMLAWAWQRLSWRVVPMHWAAVISATFFVTLNALGHLAGEWIVGGVEAKCFAYGFVLLALRELVDGRWNRLWLFLGAATAFHPLVGGWSVVVCGGIWLVDCRRQVSLLSMMPGLTAGLLLGLIGVVPALLLSWNQPPEMVAEASRIYVYERLPHHLAPLVLPREELTRRLAGHTVLIVALAGLGPILRYHVVFRMMQFAWGAVILAIMGFAIEFVLSHEPLLAARLLRYYWFRLTDFAVPMAVALAATALIMLAVTQRRAWGTWVLAATILFAGGHLAGVAIQRAKNPIPPADARMADFSAWVDVCRWISENTSAHTRFLTPRLNHSFKWRTGRPEVVNRKDIPQDTRGILEWNRRIKEIYYYEDATGINGPVDSPSQLATDRVRELAAKYGVDMVVADRSQLLSLPRAYWNEEYVVYRVPDRPSDVSR